ncbi:uncharacterized protein LOC122009383 [Zingiber officinale]|uniref:uncharacterized protein LOC122009383 n=1 Tax=Zingiber officinale TaxID=94328 RepID=UPI001C4BAD05|nr:uncharacterized protein LOC122009383 [Zingiber officinale]XP_042421445.1 uncharacterized protein LOC122009383 [Zingiber officinale]
MSKSALQSLRKAISIEIKKLHDYVNRRGSEEVEKAMQKTTTLLDQQMDSISKRQRSIELWRSACNFFVVFIIVGMLILSILYALFHKPVVSTVTSAVATGIKILEPFAESALDKKEQKLSEEKQMVQLMMQGLAPLAGNLRTLRYQTTECVSKLREEFEKKMPDDFSTVKVESVRVSVPDIVKNMVISVKDLKRQIKQYRYDVQHFETTFTKLIKKN